MKIATFNINNVNKRLANLLDWLRTARPDVACLQGLKATDSEFPVAAVGKAGYGAIWRGQKSWNGVAILARDGEPIVTHTVLPGDLADRQSRYIEAVVNGVLIATLDAPNGNPQPGPKFKNKLAWMSASPTTPLSFMRSMRRSCLRAITMSCRPTRISTCQFCGHLPVGASRSSLLERDTRSFADALRQFPQVMFPGFGR